MNMTLKNSKKVLQYKNTDINVKQMFQIKTNIKIPS